MRVEFLFEKQKFSKILWKKSEDIYARCAGDTVHNIELRLCHITYGPDLEQR